MAETTGRQTSPEIPRQEATMPAGHLSVRFDQLFEVSYIDGGFVLENGDVLTRPILDAAAVPTQENPTHRELMQERSLRLVSRAFTYPDMLGLRGTALKNNLIAREQAREGTSPEGLQAFRAFRGSMLRAISGIATSRTAELQQAIRYAGRTLWLVGSSEADEHVRFALKLLSVETALTTHGPSIVPIMSGKDGEVGILPRGLRLETLPVHIAEAEQRGQDSDSDGSSVIILPNVFRRPRP